MSRRAGHVARRLGVALKERGWQMGLVETVTGGAVADRLTDVPGSSAYFAGAVCTPSLDRLAAWLPARGALHLELFAGECAEWARDALAVDVGVAVVGLPADPLGPTSAVALALAGPGRTVTRSYRPRGGADAAQDAICRHTLGVIDRFLATLEAVPSPP
ncbi:MAG TPA: CinA family protein [Dehalococcoidia bacterium]|nr:CinA family protein [Dehalococcoidia bacterium]